MGTVKVNNSVFHTDGNAFSNNVGTVNGDVHYHGRNSEKLPQKEEIVIWLGPITVDYAHSHKKAWNLRTDDTGEWFINSPQFVEWRDGNVRYLACRGKPGVGKTVMSSVVIEYLRARFQPNTGMAISYIYIRNDERSTHSIARVLSTLLLQVIEGSSNVSNDIVKLFSECNHVNRQEKTPDVKSVKAILGVELSNFNSVFIVIDALDEWDPQEASSNTPEQLIHILESLATNVKVMVTSRNHIPFSPDASQCCGNLIIGAQSQDIQAYLSKRRREGLFKRVECSEEEMDSICRMIEDQAEGMFIVVQVMSDSISVLSSMTEILEMLKHVNVANNLDGMWDLILKRIHKSQDRELTFSFLAWMLYTEDLSAVAIQHGLAEQLEHQRNDDIDLGICLVAMEHLLSISCGLVTISRKMVCYSQREEACFQFVHFSTKESLSKIIPKYVPRAQNAIGLACIRYLSRYVLGAITEEALARHPLLRYALLHWHQHACKESCDPLSHELAFKAYQNHTHLASLFWKWHSKPTPSPKSDTLPEAYFIMALAFHGPVCMLKERWNNKFKSTNDKFGRTPLAFSALGGNTKAVQFLLGRRSNTNQLDVSKRGPISYAAEYGHIESAKLLLRPEAAWKARVPSEESSNGLLFKARELVFQLRGAELNTPDRSGSVPLLYAARDGHFEVAKLLLERGADSDRPDEDGRTPVSYAAQRGHGHVVKLLLERGADLNRPDKDGRAPISHAAGRGHEEMVKLLLERGANLGRPDEEERTPISYAAENGHEEVVRLLFERGADLNQVDNHGRGLILRAEKNGHEKVVKLLLERGADPDRPGIHRRAPISYVAERDHEEVVKLLLERGANLGRPDGDERTPISYAAENGHEELVKLLLERGADADRHDKFNRAPISYAAIAGHKEVIKLLLERGADPHRTDINGLAPFSYAAERGHKEAVKLLLEGGAEANRPDSFGRDAISYAAQNGHTEVVRLLLERGADPGRPNEDGRAPISYAAQKGHERVIELLLERGADPDQLDKEGRAPILYAALGGHKDVLSLLRRRGANPGRPDSHGRTPISCAASRGIILTLGAVSHS